MTCQNLICICILSLNPLDFHVSGAKITILKLFHLPQINEHSTPNTAPILGKCPWCPKYQQYRNCDFRVGSYNSWTKMNLCSQSMEDHSPFPWLFYSYSHQGLGLTNEPSYLSSLSQCSKDILAQSQQWQPLDYGHNLGKILGTSRKHRLEMSP